MTILLTNRARKRAEGSLSALGNRTARSDKSGAAVLETRPSHRVTVTRKQKPLGMAGVVRGRLAFGNSRLCPTEKLNERGS